MNVSYILQNALIVQILLDFTHASNWKYIFSNVVVTIIFVPL